MWSGLQRTHQIMSPTKQPIAIITIGMAGAGKSTFVQRINSYLHSQTPPSPPYVLNLDPAVTQLPFDANIDIRDTVDYQEVMRQCVHSLLVDRSFSDYLAQIQPRTKWGDLDGIKSIHDEVRSGTRLGGEAR